jgi:hypothetical protein
MRTRLPCTQHSLHRHSNLKRKGARSGGHSLRAAWHRSRQGSIDSGWRPQDQAGRLRDGALMRACSGPGTSAAAGLTYACNGTGAAAGLTQACRGTGVAAGLTQTGLRHTCTRAGAAAVLTHACMGTGAAARVHRHAPERPLLTAQRPSLMFAWWKRGWGRGRAEVGFGWITIWITLVVADTFQQE